VDSLKKKRGPLRRNDLCPPELPAWLVPCEQPCPVTVLYGRLKYDGFAVEGVFPEETVPEVQSLFGKTGRASADLALTRPAPRLYSEHLKRSGQALEKRKGPEDAHLRNRQIVFRRLGVACNSASFWSRLPCKTSHFLDATKELIEPVRRRNLQQPVVEKPRLVAGAD